MNVRRQINPDYNEGVDRKVLKTLTQRFLSLVECRLQRTRMALTPRQQVVVDLLPLLVHVNHPLLPGYVSRKTPHRLHNYQPDKNVIQQAQRLSRSFNFKESGKKVQADIVSLFLMGSTGSIAHSGSSDLDVWLCYRHGLDAAAIAELEKKARLISEWGEEMGAEIHIFLMDAQEFRSGRQQATVDSEDCGTAQHFLLLDEFYRTGIWLGGAYPLWWLIPAGEEMNYLAVAKQLLEKRFVRSSDYIDFGGCGRIPPNEFVGAGMWQLYKGIDSPYKSVLKLVLAEAYANEDGSVPPLCVTFKKAVFDDEMDPDELDPYVMIYRRIEASLSAREEWQRLDLVRRSFYLKVGENLSRLVPAHQKSWRRNIMEKLVAEWGWSDTDIRYLDQRNSWKVDEVMREKRSVVNELTGSYRFLSGYARDKGLAVAISARDIHLLGRKLYATFQRKAGKVEMINPNIAPNIAEDNLSFHHLSSQVLASSQNGWLLYRNLANVNDADFYPALKRSNSLIELIVWSYVNGLLTSATSVSLVAGETQASLFELQQIITSLRTLMHLPLPEVSQQAYRDKAQIRGSILYVNVGVDPMLDLTKRGLHKLSDRNDSLGYSSERSNLVLTLDQVTVNSWNEVMVQRYESGDTLVQSLNNTLAALAEAEQYGDKVPGIAVLCFCASRASAIASRVSKLFQQVMECFFKSDTPKRYLLEMEERYFVLQFEGRQPRFTSLSAYPELCRYLEQPQRQFRAIELDAYALKGDPLEAAFASMRPNAIQAFYWMQEEVLQLIVIDERGSVLRRNVLVPSVETFLGALSNFLYSVQERKQMHDTLAENMAASEIEFYQLLNDSKGYKPTPVRVMSQQGFGKYIEVQAIGNLTEKDRLGFNLYCEHQEFSMLEYGEQVVGALAHYLQGRFDHRPPLPCYLTDLSLPHSLAGESLRLQTIEYVKYKLELESSINAARQLPTDQGAVRSN
ncbi:adenylate cyclase [Hahella sp. CCB-MM4]|nr:adenylate cyclase [Hahella sp. CCB-MM4]